MGLVISVVCRTVCMSIKSLFGVIGFLLFVAPFLDSLKGSIFDKAMRRFPLVYISSILLFEVCIELFL